MDTLVLDAVDVEGPGRWRWQLTTETGAFVADHTVDLDVNAQEFEGFADLYEFLRWRADTDDRMASEQALVERVGKWIGDQVLGPVGDALVDAAPVAVRVVVPEQAAWLWSRPLDLGYVDGEPVATQDVTFVFQTPDDGSARRKRPVGDRLRILGVFSLPTGGSALALRRERHQLARLIQDVATTHRKGIELRVVQYGVTRARLTELVEDGDGWDVVHFSGHGLARGLLLEHDDGSHDQIGIDDLETLLRATRRQLKLVMLSSCYSAADAATTTLQQLGITTDSDGDAHGEEAAPVGVLPALARSLADRLGCAVLAMRYPVVDDFAVDLSEGFYTRLLARGQPVARALQLALPAAVATAPSPGVPAVSVATPGLYGAAAATLELPAPAGQPLVFDRERLTLADFPTQPPRFVGRAGPMARASAALAPQSERSGIIVHGMAGTGKTACALELAYTHADAFQQHVWYQAPLEGDDIATALSRWAVHLEDELPGLELVHTVDNADRFAAQLPYLVAFLERHRVLLVIDNAESLLTDAGGWRDARWGLLIDALAAADGLSRLILTSRRRPASLDGRMLVEAIHALSRDEAVLLARELPNLSKLIAGTHPDIDAAAARDLAAKTLAAVQGHPKLMELADADAADPDRLQQRLTTADESWAASDTTVEAFLASGETTADASDYRRVLDGWTRTATADLPPAAGDLFALLCCVEPDDRHSHVLDGNWADLWRRLDRPGDPPNIDPLLDDLAARALLDPDTPTDASGAGDGGTMVWYRIHPAVADTTRHHTTAEFRMAADRELAAYWKTIATHAQQQEGVEASGWVAHAGVHAAPYLLRIHEWATASTLLEKALTRDKSPATIATILPQLRQIADATTGTEDELTDLGVLAKALRHIDPDQAEQQMRDIVARAAATNDHATVAAAAGELTNMLRTRGRLDDALAAADAGIDHGQRAAGGEWTTLGYQLQRLQILEMQGHYQQVLDEIADLEEHMATLPDQRDDTDTVEPWNVRETLHDTARHAAQGLGQWETALTHNQAEIDSKTVRDAPAVQIATSRFNDYPHLLGLGRLDDARQLLLACLAVFQHAHSVGMLGKTYSGLANVEEKRGNLDDAIDLERRALRYKYLAGDVDSIPVSHFNLASYLRLADVDAGEAIAHRLADAIICYHTGSGGLAQTVAALHDDLTAAGDAPPTPAPFDDLADRVERIPGVAFRALIDRLAEPDIDHNAILAQLLQQARNHDTAAATVAWHLQRWEPTIRRAVAAVRGDTETRDTLTSMLDDLADTDDWANLAAAIRRILDGDTNRDSLTSGLDAIDTAIIDAILDDLDQPHTTDPDLA